MTPPHSLALGDWLLRSGMRTERQMAEIEVEVFKREWNLPHDNHLGMLIYAMVQELATWLNYRNLRYHAAGANGDEALSTLLTYVAVDERAHFDFFRRCVQLYLEHDRPGRIGAVRFDPLARIRCHRQQTVTRSGRATRSSWVNFAWARRSHPGAFDARRVMQTTRKARAR